MANMSAEKASQRKEEWLEDVLDDVEENAQVEAFDDVSAETAPPSRADNVTQILKKNFSVYIHIFGSCCFGKVIIEII